MTPEAEENATPKHRFVAAGALAALVVVTLTAGSDALEGRHLPWTIEAALWGLVAALAATHRPFGGTGLGLGAVVLPAVVDRLGSMGAALVAGAVRLVIALYGRAAERRGASEGWLLFGGVAAAAVAAAALAGAALRTHGALAAVPFVWRATLPAAAYVLTLVLIAAAGRGLLKRIWRRLWRATDAAGVLPLTLDGAAWIIGALLADAAAALGWGKVAALALAMALLAAEAARNALARGASDQRVVSFERLHRAHERILGETSGMAAVADQILVACSNILPVYWYHFELARRRADDDPERWNWTAGPGTALEQGRPRPPERPPMLPGVHRRAAWHVIEQPLAVDGETLAWVRLWCDPRQIERGAEELFATLVPQMAASVHRTLLDREARLDPLTGIPVRRLLESSLHRSFRHSCDEGLSMAVIMCDVDHFKKVNDTHGHDAGDQALIRVAKALDASRREDDLCCRYGGEEFTLLLGNTSGDAALGLAERLRQAVKEIDLVYEGRRIPLSISAGVAAFPELFIKTAGELLLLADEALYEAKERGRDRCLLNLGRGAFGSISSDVPSSSRVPR